MSTSSQSAFTVTKAHVACLTAYLTAIILGVFTFELAAIPLFIFLALCFTAPFFPAFSFYLPIITRGRSGKQAIALTFDDGPDSNTTGALLKLLKKHNTPATFFITGKKAAENRDLVQSILAHGHTLGNHTWNHDTMIMLKSFKKLKHEIESTNELLQSWGITALLFRPPAGITNPKLGKILLCNNMHCVNYSCRAFDAGNRRINNLARKILKKVKPDDIILLHDTTPPKNTVENWLIEVEKLIVHLEKKGIKIVSLSEIIDMPVMRLKDIQKS